jgi:hypothetical protein
MTQVYPGVSAAGSGTGVFNGTNPNPDYSGIFIPQIWSGKLVEKFYAATVLAAISNTDYEGEIKNFGDTVNIRVRPDITINDYTFDMDLAVQRPSSNLVVLQINQGKYFNVALDDVLEIQSDVDLLNIWAQDAAEQMKIKVDTDVLSYLSTTTDIDSHNYGAAAGVVTGAIDLGTTGAPIKVSANTAPASTYTYVLDLITQAGQTLDEANIPESGRWMVIPAWMATLIKQSDLRNASIAGDMTSVLRNGRLGEIDRFTLYYSNLLPTLGVSSNMFPVYFGVPAALTFAAQFTKMETIRSERSFSNLVRGLQVYGFKVVTAKAMGRAIVQNGGKS